MVSILHNFKVILPRYKINQNETLNWVTNAHTLNLIKNNERESSSISENEITEKTRKIVQKFSCKSDKISTRYSEISDFTHNHYNDMCIFNLEKNMYGKSIAERMKFFEEKADRSFESFYENENTAPEHIIHVTCTGYLSPSSAQKYVSKNNLGSVCEVTHVYHMGCYASIPAIRIAHGLLNSNHETFTVDIVHTELCSLHFNPGKHTPEQFVVESLFADGFIKYSITNHLDHLTKKNKKGLLLHSTQEIIYQNSENFMTWNLFEYSFVMTISRNIPTIIKENIESFLEKLFLKNKLNYAQNKSNCIFAIHPGGPKIIEYVQNTLSLTNEQVQFSNKIMNNRGNMSSATLPHVWDAILQSETTQQGTYVISLAFGPGLTIAGALLEII